MTRGELRRKRTTIKRRPDTSRARESQSVSPDILDSQLSDWYRIGQQYPFIERVLVGFRVSKRF